MVEIAQGILKTVHPCVHGVVASKSGFVYELEFFNKNGETYFQTDLQAIILMTRSQGGVAIDGESKKFKDQAGLLT